MPSPQPSSANPFDGALASYNYAIEKDPQDEEARHARGEHGEHYESLANRDRAISDYSRALAINPDRLDTRLDRAFCYAWPEQHEAASLGHMWFMKNEHEKAICCYSKTIALDPVNADYYKHRAEVHEYDRNDRLAAADYSQAIALDPANADLYMSRAPSNSGGGASSHR